MHPVFLLFSLIALTNARNQYLDFKLLGGADTDISKHPYQVSIEELGMGHICGGALIGRKLVLTAASCMGKLPHFYAVRVGSSIREDSGFRTDIQTINYHWEIGFGESDEDFDVCVLTLSYALPLGPFIRVIPLARPNIIYTTNRLQAVFTGWGRQQEGSNLAVRLQAVKLDLVPHRVCKAFYRPIGKTITDRMMCFGVGGRGFCKGDAGSPLVHSGALIGIASWSVGCARSQLPGVFVNVTNPLIYGYIQWIIKKTADNQH